MKSADSATALPSSIFGASKAALTVLAVVCVMNLLARGFMETHAIFMLSLEQEFEWSRTEVSGIYSIAMLTFGLTGPAVGFLSPQRRGTDLSAPPPARLRAAV